MANDNKFWSAKGQTPAVPGDTPGKEHWGNGGQSPNHGVVAAVVAAVKATFSLFGRWLGGD